MALAGRKVLLLAADLFEDMELLYPLYRLGEDGVAVTVAGLDDQPVTGKKGHGPVAVDTTVDMVAAADFDALVQRTVSSDWVVVTERCGHAASGSAGAGSALGCRAR